MKLSSILSNTEYEQMNYISVCAPPFSVKKKDRKATNGKKKKRKMQFKPPNGENQEGNYE